MLQQVGDGDPLVVATAPDQPALIDLPFLQQPLDFVERDPIRGRGVGGASPQEIKSSQSGHARELHD
jgi:hypothetical protein